MRWVVFELPDFDWKASNGEEEKERLWWVRIREWTQIKTEKDELEATKPSDEEGSEACGEDSGEV